MWLTNNMQYKQAIEELIAKKDRIPDEFWIQAKCLDERVIWFVDRQKPSVVPSYDFDEERFGLTMSGKIVWGFDSGCSCPSPWEDNVHDETYSKKEWTEYVLGSEAPLDNGWQDGCFDNMRDYLLLTKEDVSINEVLEAKNAEVRRYLMKRVGYENIRNLANVSIIATDGTSELLKIGYDQYVKVKDASTDREYLLYVPEWIKTCKQGIAWTFGLKEFEYNPTIET